MDRDLFVRYAQMKRDIAALEADLDEMKPLIMEALEETEEKRVNLEGYGMFSVYPTRKWSYSSLVMAMEGELKNTKKEEEANGTAECAESFVLKFISEKGE